MIAYDLNCGAGHRFEGWFSSSADFDAQRASGMLGCPVCGDLSITKALSVPNVGRKGNQAVTERASVTAAPEAVTGEVMNAPTLPPAMTALMEKLAAAQTEMLKESDWVGRAFAETARAIHYGEEDNRLIHGETSREEAEELVAEGIAVAPLPFPVVPPSAKN